jgi:hypothetical protein
MPTGNWSLELPAGSVDARDRGSQGAAVRETDLASLRMA